MLVSNMLREKKKYFSNCPELLPDIIKMLVRTKTEGIVQSMGQAGTKHKGIGSDYGINMLAG